MDYIDLNNHIFTIEPDIIFSKSMNVPIGFWNDLYKRHKFWDYGHDEMVEWFEFKQHKQISKKTLYRWIIRQEVYNDAQRALKLGANRVSLDFFTRNKDFILKISNKQNG